MTCPSSHRLELAEPGLDVCHDMGSARILESRGVGSASKEVGPDPNKPSASGCGKCLDFCSFPQAAWLGS